jgi:hypothetical protein
MYDENTASSMIPAVAVRARYKISNMTLCRWLRREGLEFPKPVSVNGRRFWRLDDLVNWEKARPAWSARRAPHLEKRITE